MKKMNSLALTTVCYILFMHLYYYLSLSEPMNEEKEDGEPDERSGDPIPEEEDGDSGEKPPGDNLPEDKESYGTISKM